MECITAGLDAEELTWICVLPAWLSVSNLVFPDMNRCRNPVVTKTIFAAAIKTIPICNCSKYLWIILVKRCFLQMFSAFHFSLCSSHWRQLSKHSSNHLGRSRSSEVFHSRILYAVCLLLWLHLDAISNPLSATSVLRGCSFHPLLLLWRCLVRHVSEGLPLPSRLFIYFKKPLWSFLLEVSCLWKDSALNVSSVSFEHFLTQPFYSLWNMSEWSEDLLNAVCVLNSCFWKAPELNDVLHWGCFPSLSWLRCLTTPGRVI